MFKIFSLTLVSTALATTEQMTNDYDAQKALLEQAGKVVAPTGAGQPRTITGSDMGLINEYGCWCYFENGHYQAKSGPVDPIDILCKRLHDGYACAMLDAKDMGFECIPWAVPYNSAIGTGLVTNMDITTIRSECDTQNPVTNSCENWACKIEGYFVQQLLQYFVNGGLINQDNRHDNGFDPNLSCPTKDGPDSERECCDQQPLRFPFKTYDGSRDCCINHTFDTNMFSCCNDGTVQISCTP